MKHEITNEIQLVNIKYSINFETSPKFQKVIITPCLKVDSKINSVLVASLKVDGHELLPTAKVSLNNGISDYQLPSVNIMRRKQADSTFDDHPSAYKLELVAMHDSDHYIIDTQYIDLKDY